MKAKAAGALLSFATGSVCYCIYLFCAVLPWSVRHRHVYWMFPMPIDYYPRSYYIRLWWQIAETDVLLMWCGLVLFIVPALVAFQVGKRFEPTLNRRSVQVSLGILSLAALSLSVYGIKLILPPLPLPPLF